MTIWASLDRCPFVTIWLIDTGLKQYGGHLIAAVYMLPMHLVKLKMEILLK